MATGDAAADADNNESKKHVSEVKPAADTVTKSGGPDAAVEDKKEQGQGKDQDKDAAAESPKKDAEKTATQETTQSQPTKVHDGQGEKKMAQTQNIWLPAPRKANPRESNGKERAQQKQWKHCGQCKQERRDTHAGSWHRSQASGGRPCRAWRW